MLHLNQNMKGSGVIRTNKPVVPNMPPDGSLSQFLKESIYLLTM